MSTWWFWFVCYTPLLYACFLGRFSRADDVPDFYKSIVQEQLRLERLDDGQVSQEYA